MKQTDEKNILAKFNPDITLMEHSLAVAACVVRLCIQYYTNAFERIRKHLHMQKEDALRFMAYIAAMHDIGKIHPDFQAHSDVYATFSEDRKSYLSDALKTTKAGQPGFRHEMYSKDILEKIWKRENLMSDMLIETFVTAISLHHQGKNRSKTSIAPFREKFYFVVQSDFEKTLRDFFNVKFPEVCDNHSVVGDLMLGILTDADWIASAADFSMDSAHDIDEYYKNALRVAKENVESIGLIRSLIKDINSIQDLYPEITHPRPMQMLINEIDVENDPSIAIIEDLPGSGKTEAAVTAAFRLKQHYDKAGVSMFLPTGATSNQAYERFAKMLENIDNGKLRLVHSTAWTVDNANVLSLGTDGELGESFLASSRLSMQHPYVVGTVDQAELAVMNKKYSVLRLLGLTEKVVIIDEVHAYDAYMGSILNTLLRWCRELDIPVILLSATLPSSVKRSYLQAAGIDNTASFSEEYPLLTIGYKSGKMKELHCEPFTRKKYNITTQAISDPLKIALLAVKKASKGGNICVFVNSVRKAQAVYEELQTLGYPVKYIYHARFTNGDRAEKEKVILSNFSKGGTRPDTSITICTQVCEQSLDVSFDYIITELCPIDILFQRLGRLLRFPHNVPSWIDADCPEVTVLTGEYGVSKLIYHEYFLKHTEAYLKDHKIIHLPDDMRDALETVYSLDLSDEKAMEILCDDDVMKHAAKLAKKDDPDARSYYIANKTSMFGLFENDIDSQGAEVSTRFDASSVQLLLANKENADLINDYRDACVAKNHRKEYACAKELMNYVVSARITPGASDNYEAKGKLSGCYVLTPDKNGNYYFGDYVLTYSSETGLSYKKIK